MTARLCPRRWLAAVAVGCAAILVATGCQTGMAGTTGTGGTGGGTGNSATSKHPNIIFVLTDDLAWNLIKYMPNVQKMQQNGSTFSNYYVTDSLCCPSRSSMFSGRYPHDTGVYTNGGNDGGYNVFHGRGEEKSTWGTDLQAAGYRTAMMGKYLNGYQPKDAPPPGWNEWDVAGNGYPEFNYNLNSNGKIEHHGTANTDYLTDVLNGKAKSFVDSSAAANKPFAMEIATFAPHAPYTPAPRDADKFPGLTAPRTPAFNTADKVGNPPWLQQIPPLSQQDIAKLNQSFRKRAQAVQAVDKMIGDLRQELAAKHLDKNTYLVFASDNGYHMGEHRLRAGKQTAFDTDIKVPLIAIGPSVPAGHTTDQQASNIDLRPTFDQLGGAVTPPEVDGHSLVAPLHSSRPVDNWRNAVLVEHHGQEHPPGDPDKPGKFSADPPSYNALRLGSAVYVEYADGEREYYDTAKDPDELSNIVGTLPPDTVNKLHADLTALTACHSGTACWQAAHVNG